jgi:response regulator RpfG family c-di-GMP phosphodiesterase
MPDEADQTPAGLGKSLFIPQGKPIESPLGFFSFVGNGSDVGSGRPGAGRETARILVLGSDDSRGAWLGKVLRDGGHEEVCVARDMPSALESLHHQRCAVLLADLSAGGACTPRNRGRGVELLARVKAVDPRIEIIAMTDQQDMEAALDLMRGGAFDCLTSPGLPWQILSCVGCALERRRQVLHEQAYYDLIERTVYRRTLELNTMFYELEEAYRQTLWALGSALESRDIDTNAHSIRVMMYSRVLAQAMGITGNRLQDLEFGVFLHDIGKIGVPDEILHTPGKLPEEWWVKMREHPRRGRYLLAGIQFLEGSVDIVYCHHERWDGGGYPRGLRRDQIPLGARIFAVGDTLDAITSDRPYRAAQSYQRAREEILANSGTQFDPAVVAFFREFSEADWKKLRAEAEELAYSIERRKLACLKD